MAIFSLFAMGGPFGVLLYFCSAGMWQYTDGFGDKPNKRGEHGSPWRL